MIRCNPKTGEVFLYGIVGSSSINECFDAGEVVQALDRLNGSRALVRINSPGGVADEGIAIYNALKRYSGGVDTFNDAIAASAASVIFLAGDKRFASMGSRVMIHQAMTLAVGNADELLKTASTLKKYDESLIAIYARYLRKSPLAISDMMRAETWFNDSESVAVGLAPGLEKSTTAEPMIASWFKRTPAALLARTQQKKASVWRAKIAAIKHRIN